MRSFLLVPLFLVQPEAITSEVSRDGVSVYLLVSPSSSIPMLGVRVLTRESPPNDWEMLTLLLYWFS